MGKHYTFNVRCSFSMQYTFTDDEVEPTEEGGESDVDPTSAALKAIERELQEHLSEQYGSISELDVGADFDDLLGVVDDDGSKGGPGIERPLGH